MKRTYLPKILTLSACVWAFLSLPFASALALSSLVCVLCFLLLSLPVFVPASTFYGPSLSRSPAKENTVALSFDDGPDPRYTRKILDYLEQEAIKAIFFVVGERAARHPDLIREILARGHIIGNHSYTHSLGFHFGLKKSYRDELTRFDETIKSIAGLKCRFFRPPQGFRTPLLADVLQERKLLNVAWSCRGYDSVRRDKERIFESLKKDLGSGSLILLHDGGGLGGREERLATLEVLPMIVREARERGFRFQRLDHFLKEAPYFTSS